MKAEPGSTLTLCWMDRSGQLQEICAFLLKAYAGKGRSLLVLYPKPVNGQADAAPSRTRVLTARETQALEIFANCCSQMKLPESLSTSSHGTPRPPGVKEFARQSP